MVKTIESFYSPIRISDLVGGGSELSRDDLGFICGVIKKYEPKNIVEIGVSTGCTSAVILKCIEELGLESELHSIDLALKCHLNVEKECGYKLKEAFAFLEKTTNVHLMLGKTIAERIDEVVKHGKIDLLILDTTHYLPGELLDFLVCYPYMSEEAVVIVDDLAFAHIGESRSAIATPVLFSAIAAKKLLPEKCAKLNMAGFVLGRETKQYIENLFYALGMPWSYDIGEKTMEEYKEKIYKNYDKDSILIFDNVLELQQRTLENMKKAPIKLRELLIELDNKKEILIYGAGARGTALKKFLEDRGYTIKGFVISDGRDKKVSLQQDLIYNLSEVKDDAEKYNILVALADQTVRKQLKEAAIDYIDIPNYLFPFIKRYAEYLYT